MISSGGDDNDDTEENDNEENDYQENDNKENGRAFVSGTTHFLSSW